MRNTTNASGWFQISVAKLEELLRGGRVLDKWAAQIVAWNSARRGGLFEMIERGVSVRARRQVLTLRSTFGHYVHPQRRGKAIATCS